MEPIYQAAIREKELARPLIQITNLNYSIRFRLQTESTKYDTALHFSNFRFFCEIQKFWYRLQFFLRFVNYISAAPVVSRYLTRQRITDEK